MKIATSFVLFSVLFLTSLTGHAQNVLLASADTAVRTVYPAAAVDRAPSLTGAQPNPRQWIAERLSYPDLALDYAIEGRVVIGYVVGPDGSVSDVKVHKGLGFGCDEAALALLQKMPRWNPAFRNGRAVAVQCYTPIDFKLQ